MASFNFLLCSERSGSNLIAKVIDGHPAIAGPSPKHLFRHFCLNTTGYGDLSVDANWDAFLEDLALFHESAVATWKSAVTVEELKKAVAERTVFAALRYVHEKEARANGKEILFLKENHTYEFLAFLVAHFPESKFIWQVRDPRDMVLTWNEAKTKPGGGTRTAAAIWREDQYRSRLAYGFLRNLGRILLVKFEDLILKTEETAGRMCAFLGVPYSEAMLRFYEGDSATSNAVVSSWKDLAKPIIKDNVNRYRTNLSEAEIRYVEAVCHEEMAALGYQREYDPIGSPEELAKDVPAGPAGMTVAPEEKDTYDRFFAAIARVHGRKAPLE